MSFARYGPSRGGQLYLASGEVNPDYALADRVPHLPQEVIDTCIAKEIALDSLSYDFLCGYWFPKDGWRGMYLGIEKDGHAHT